MADYKKSKIYLSQDGYNRVYTSAEYVTKTIPDPSTLTTVPVSSGLLWTTVSYVRVSWDNNKHMYRHEGRLTVATNSISCYVDESLTVAMRVRAGSSPSYSYYSLSDVGYYIEYNEIAKRYYIWIFGYATSDYYYKYSSTFQCQIKYGRTYCTANKTISVRKSHVILGDILNKNYDKIACKAVKSINLMSTAWYNNNTDMQVTFTPITDHELLNAVTNGKTIIRVQLLYHQPCGGQYNQHNKRQYGVFLQTSSQYYQVCLWRRPFSHDPKKYGCTWKNLTAAELQSGAVILTNIKYGASSNSFTRPGNNRTYQYASAELYVPALGKGTSDTFEYERQGYRRVASYSSKLSFEPFIHSKYQN